MAPLPNPPCPAHYHFVCCAALQVISAELDYKFACSGYDVRSFVNAALESMSLGGGLEAAKAELLAAVDEAERSSGAELGGGNDKGWQVGGGSGRVGHWAAGLLACVGRQLGRQGIWMLLLPTHPAGTVWPASQPASHACEGIPLTHYPTPRPPPLPCLPPPAAAATPCCRC